MALAERIGHTLIIADSFKLSAIVIAPTGPYSVPGTVLSLKNLNSVSKAFGVGKHIGCQRGQFGVKVARQMAAAYRHFLNPPHRLDWDWVTSRQKSICYDDWKQVATR